MRKATAGRGDRRLALVMQTFCLAAASHTQSPAEAGDGRSDPDYFFGCSIVPVHFLLPQRQAQIFFRRAVCFSSSVMP
jgi:hypothetical protein